MPKHMHREMGRLMEGALNLAELVQCRVKSAVQAVVSGDVSLAQSVIDGDDEIDRLEVDLEEECLKLLALYQPVAIDLRMIVSVLKMNNDMERIGDIAANIAERALSLADYNAKDIPLDLTGMAEKVQSLLSSALRSLVDRDPEVARTVCRLDDEIDKIHADGYKIIGDKIISEPQNAHIHLQVLSISRYLERIADLATNIAEDVIYLVEGVIVRHSL